MDTDELNNKYRKMPIDELALIEKSYPESEFTPEAQKVINEVLKERKKELEDYRKQSVADEVLNDEIIEEKKEGCGIYVAHIIIAFILAALVVVIWGAIFDTDPPKWLKYVCFIAAWWIVFSLYKKQRN